MYAILIKLRGVRADWTDTGIRTERPEVEKRDARIRNPDCYVQAAPEHEIAKWTGVGRG
jgi:hypothetical protein